MVHFHILNFYNILNNNQNKQTADEQEEIEKNREIKIQIEKSISRNYLFIRTYYNVDDFSSFKFFFQHLKPSAEKKIFQL